MCSSAGPGVQVPAEAQGDPLALGVHLDRRVELGAGSSDLTLQRAMCRSRACSVIMVVGTGHLQVDDHRSRQSPPASMSGCSTSR